MLEFLASVFSGLRPALPLLASIGVLLLVIGMPLPGRGPGFLERRDPWRGYKFAARREVMDRAGGRCEAPLLLIWGRCSSPATDADHVYPWSRSGPTVASNGQALCRHHNRRKSNLRPPWWYVLGLERRRRGYFHEGTAVRVSAKMTAADRELRQRPPADRRPTRPR